jgi:hypothetical protein
LAPMTRIQYTTNGPGSTAGYVRPHLLPPTTSVTNFGRQEYACTCTMSGLASIFNSVTGCFGTLITTADPFLCTSPTIPLGVRCNELHSKAHNTRQAIPSCQVMLTSGEYMGYEQWRNDHPSCGPDISRFILEDRRNRRES